MMIIRKAGGLAALCVAATALASPVLAAGRDNLDYSVRVSRAAVSPSGPAEARRSLMRLDSAALEACGASSFSLSQYRDAIRHSSCWNVSMRDAVGRIDNPYLTAAFSRRGTVEVAQNEAGSRIHAR